MGKRLRWRRLGQQRVRALRGYPFHAGVAGRDLAYEQNSTHSAGETRRTTREPQLPCWRAQRGIEQTLIYHERDTQN